MKNRFLCRLLPLLFAGAAIASPGWDEFSIPRTVILAPAKSLDGSSGVVTNNPIDCSQFQGRAKIDIFCYTNPIITLSNITIGITVSTNSVISNYVEVVTNSTLAIAITTNDWATLADNCYTNYTVTNPVSIHSNAAFTATTKTNFLVTNSVSITTNLTLGTNYTTAVSGGTLSATLIGSRDLSTWWALSNLAVVTTSTATISTNIGDGVTATNNSLLPFTVTSPTAASAGFATPYGVPKSFTNSGAISVNSGLTSIGFNIASAPRYVALVWTPGGTVTNFTVTAILTTPTR